MLLIIREVYRLLERKDYPVFSYFMELIGAYGTYIDTAFFFKEAANKKRRMELKAEILKLKKKDPWEVQAFIGREFGLGIKQKNVPATFDTILNIIEQKKAY